MSSKILLVNPPFYRLLGSHYNANSLGIAYIAAYLNENGHDSWLYNADYLNQREYAALREIFDSFTDYTHFFKNENDPIWEEVSQKIIDFKPDWVGYTSYTANISAIDIISKKVSKMNPTIKQVIGGTHATLDGLILEKLKKIDYSIRREGEEAMLALVNGVDPRKISGVVSRDGIGFCNNGDANVIKSIDDLPFPERNKLYSISESEKPYVDVSYICSIRGCPYRCNYCASPYSWKRDKTQYRSPDSVIAEMKYVKKNHWDTKKLYDYSASANTQSKEALKIIDNTIVYFVDDVFTINKPRVKNILRQMIDQDLGMDWKCEARTDHFDEEICELMSKAGCVRVKLGFESGSDRILKEIQKDETIEDMRRGAKMLKEAGVPFTAYFMTGFPGETDEDLKQTIEFAKEIEADYYSLSVMAPYFGTKIYYDLIDRGFELDKKPWEYFFHQTGEMLANNHLSDEMVDEFLDLNKLNEAGKGYV